MLWYRVRQSLRRLVDHGFARFPASFGLYIEGAIEHSLFGPTLVPSPGRVEYSCICGENSRAGAGREIARYADNSIGSAKLYKSLRSLSTPRCISGAAKSNVPEHRNWIQRSGCRSGQCRSRQSLRLSFTSRRLLGLMSRCLKSDQPALVGMLKSFMKSKADAAWDR